MTRRVLVIGGGGTLGVRIRSALEITGEFDVVTGTRRPDGNSSEVQLDAQDRSSISATLDADDYSAVIVAVPQTDPLVQQACASRDLPCIDVAPTDELRRTEQDTLRNATSPLVTMCGFHPGLSGLMATDTTSGLDELHELHVGLLQSTNASVGATGVKDMLSMLTLPVRTPQGLRPGFAQKRPMSFGPRRVNLRRMHHDEASALKEKFATAEVAYYTAWSSTPFTLMIAALNRSGILRRVVQSRLRLTPRHNPAKPEIAHLRVEATGTVDGTQTTRHRSVEVLSDYKATACVVAVLTRLVLDRPARFSGIVTPMDIVSLDEVKYLLDSAVIRFS
ncbi:hypothetical protein [Nesterenkonia muleiensis]|uniref:hypothetical protein n=1 Tax=Nesterenkonia muleiensis TaxID=2282648 RepID=UPI0013007478|nr:hypothetical protein [Nesterenkonia muleiensis]